MSTCIQCWSHVRCIKTMREPLLVWLCTCVTLVFRNCWCLTELSLQYCFTYSMSHHLCLLTCREPLCCISCPVETSAEMFKCNLWISCFLWHSQLFELRWKNNGQWNRPVDCSPKCHIQSACLIVCVCVISSTRKSHYLPLSGCHRGW